MKKNWQNSEKILKPWKNQKLGRFNKIAAFDELVKKLNSKTKVGEEKTNGQSRKLKKK